MCDRQVLYLTGFKYKSCSPEYSLNYKVLGACATVPKTDSMFIQLVGPQRTTATSLTFAVDDVSTAVLGTDFSISTPSPVAIALNTIGVKVRVILNKVTSQKKWLSI